MNFLVLPNGSLSKNNHLTFTNLLKTFQIDRDIQMNLDHMKNNRVRKKTVFFSWHVQTGKILTTFIIHF